MGGHNNKTAYFTRRKEVYHTDLDCLNLQRAPHVREAPIEDVDGEFPLCKRCAGEYSPHSGHHPRNLVQRLREMDPDDAG